MAGVPQFVVVDFEKEVLEVAGVKMKTRNLLWEITRMIEGRQGGKK